MPQTTILAPGNTAATTPAITLLEGQSVFVGIYAATGKATAIAGELARVTIATPGTPATFLSLTSDSPVRLLDAPAGSGGATFNVERNALPAGADIGVFKNQA